MPTLSVVIPHWPLDDETNDALRRCVASFPPECERIVVVNDGTGYGRNVNIGLRVASGDYIAVVNNDCRLVEGDVYDLCVPETVTSPLVVGRRQGFGESIEPGGFHGSFWVVPRPVLQRVGLLDERYERAYWEDDDFLARLRQTGIPKGSLAWHFCQNCPRWPVDGYEEAAPTNDYGLDTPPIPPGGEECEECRSLRECRECAFY